ncbi:M43 family zinc metalloprotease [Rubrivirga sp. IMCC45206]|uniref:M43 family zinc metalloprotease n=1 Tax=Rubrivirga sp. IMCC45206 TaxID=3391614 RepID=UPI0039900AEE
MRLSAVGLLVLLLAPATGAQVTLDGRRCATPSPTVAQSIERAAIVQRHRELSALRIGPDAPTTVPVVFHVLTDGTRGDLPLAMLEAQVDTLNSAFRTTGFRFALAAVNRVDNADWYTDLRLGSGEERAMKRALQVDPARVLNVYTASLGLDYLGWATLPYGASERDETDGVVVLDRSLPGGTAAPYNLGHTGTHEVGHWLGLDHTFAGGCSSINDGVADTPQEASPASGCPVSRDSCPLDPGLDPVRNYMDYSHDSCMTNFTPGQAERTDALVGQYRPTLVAGGYALAFAEDATENLFVHIPTTVGVRVTNASDQPLTVSGATSTQADVSLAPAVVAPGAVAVLDLAITARQSGAFAVRIDTDAAGPEALVTIDGTAFAPPTARLDVTGVELTLLEGVSRSVSFVIANDGDGPLTFDIDTAALPSWVREVTPASGTVAPHTETTVEVTVTGVNVAPSAYAQTLDIATNDPLRGAVEVALALNVLVRPDALAAGPSFPNPTRGVVTIPLELPTDLGIRAEVYDTQGRRVAVLADGRQLPAGYPELTWDASRVPAGVYAVRVWTLAESAFTRIVVIR